MLSTKTESVKKSMRCSKKDRYHLQLNSTNFWEFYVYNKEALDATIFSHIVSYQKYLDLDDLHQEIILRFYRCNVLAKFDPDKSKLNTYMINTINGYAQSIFHSMTKTHSWNPWPTQDIDSDESFHYEQTYFESMNGYTPSNQDIQLPYELAAAYSTEDQLALMESVEQVKKNLPVDAVNVFDLMVAGNSKGDVAVILGSKPPEISAKVKRIKETCRKVYNIKEN